MAERQGGRADAEPAAADAWKAPFANGAIFAVVAAMLFWGAFREFRPPPEEPTSVEQMLKEADETLRSGRELTDLLRERSRITDAIDDRIEALEARRAEGQDRDGLDDELRRLRKTLLAELETTNRLVGERNAAGEEEERQEDAKRRERVARAAWEWQRARWRLLAMAAAAAALAGWLFWQAHIRHARHVVTAVAAQADGRAGSPRRAHADLGGGDPQRGQKLPFYALQVGICLMCVLFGLLGPEPKAGAKHGREDLVIFGLAGLALSTIWLFFGSIDWSTWNAIKGLVNGKAAGDTDGTRDNPR